MNFFHDLVQALPVMRQERQAQVQQRHRLRSGDKLSVSGVTFEFHQPGNGKSAA